MIDSALLCLVYIAQILGIPADEKQLRRAYALGDRPMDAGLFLRVSQALGIKSRLVRPTADRLPRLPKRRRRKPPPNPLPKPLPR